MSNEEIEQLTIDETNVEKQPITESINEVPPPEIGEEPLPEIQNKIFDNPELNIGYQEKTKRKRGDMIPLPIEKNMITTKKQKTEMFDERISKRKIPEKNKKRSIDHDYISDGSNTYQKRFKISGGKSRKYIKKYEKKFSRKVNKKSKKRNSRKNKRPIIKRITKKK